MPGRQEASGLLAILILLTGCAGPAGAPSSDVSGDVPDPPASVAATTHTGGLRCIAVDEALRPVENVMISIRPSNRGALTDADGRCVIDGLDPGTYLVWAEKEGYEAAFSSATVRPGEEEPEPLRFVMPYIGREGAFAVTHFHQLTLAAALVAGGTEWAVAPGTGDELDHDLHRSTAWPDVTHVQSELVWEPQSPFAEVLSIECWIAPDQGASNRTEGTSMVPNVVRPVTRGDDDDYHCYIGPVGTGPGGLALYVDQDIRVFTTIFYGFLPEAHWFFTLDGEHPPP